MDATDCFAFPANTVGNYGKRNPTMAFSICWTTFFLQFTPGVAGYRKQEHTHCLCTTSPLLQSYSKVELNMLSSEVELTGSGLMQCFAVHVLTKSKQENAIPPKNCKKQRSVS